MGTYGPGVSSSHDGVTSGAVTATTPSGTARVWEVPSAAVTFTAVNALTVPPAPLPDLVVPAGDLALTWTAVYPNVDAISITRQGGGPTIDLISVEAQRAGAQTVADVQTALTQSTDALAAANEALRIAGQGGIGGGGPITIAGVTGTSFTLAQIHARDDRQSIPVTQVTGPQVIQDGLYSSLNQIPPKADLVGGKVPATQLPATGSQSRPLMQLPSGKYPARSTASTDPTLQIYFRMYYTAEEPVRGTDGAAAYAADPANGIPGDILIVGVVF